MRESDDCIVTNATRRLIAISKAIMICFMVIRITLDEPLDGPMRAHRYRRPFPFSSLSPFPRRARSVFPTLAAAQVSYAAMPAKVEIKGASRAASANHSA